MAFDLTTFRASFPEFASTTTYPDAQITFWSGLGVLQLIETRWSTLYDYGLNLFTAHHLTLATDKRNSGGPVSSQGAGDVSVSYDTQQGLEADAGHWNTTTYGRQFIKLARMVGMGGCQL